MNRITVFAVGVLLSVISCGAVAEELKTQCKDSPRVVGECFKVHGRISISNGIPYRLWIVGTHRILAPDPNDIPESVENLLELGLHENISTVEAMSVDVFGDYDVCPLEKNHPGWMRAVCIESASHLVAVKWDGTLVNGRP